MKERRSINVLCIRSERLNYVCQGSADVGKSFFTMHDLFVPALEYQLVAGLRPSLK